MGKQCPKGSSIPLKIVGPTQSFTLEKSDGFNSAILVLNDHLHEIEDDRDFGAKVVKAIQRDHLSRPYEPTDFE
jgi:hypothetical protein